MTDTTIAGLKTTQLRVPWVGEPPPNGIMAAEDRLYLVVEVMTKGGLKTADFPDSERKRWASMMPNIAQQWADRQEKRGLPGREVLTAFMNELRARNIPIAREWDKK